MDDSRSFAKQNSGLLSLPHNIATAEAELLLELNQFNPDLGPQIERMRELGLLPYFTGSKIEPEFRLLLDIADDLSQLRIFQIERPLSRHELNTCGRFEFAPGELRLMAEISEPRLLFSPHAIVSQAPKAELSSIFELYTRGKRITRYRDIDITWQSDVDRGVWTTNIDTVFFIKQLFDSGVFKRRDIRSAGEIGVGGGAISKTLAANLPDLHELVITDISAWALVCARRNIDPAIPQDVTLAPYLGKGIRGVHTAFDLLVVNPPYIPHMERPDAVDPYRGTGLIKEIVETGLQKLNPENEHACIYLGTSSLAQKDLDDYLSGADSQLKCETIGTALEVPLKIEKINTNSDWTRFLVEECDLRYYPERLDTHGFEYWHEISVLKLSRQIEA